MNVSLLASLGFFIQICSSLSIALLNVLIIHSPLGPLPFLSFMSPRVLVLLYIYCIFLVVLLLLLRELLQFSSVLVIPHFDTTSEHHSYMNFYYFIYFYFGLCGWGWRCAICKR